MGAAASVQLAYQDAILWFRQYFDAETYIEDFRLIDKDHDGAIRFKELQQWLTHKAKTEGGPWKYFINNSEIFTMAHYHSSKYVVDKFLVKKKIVDIIEFRTLLVQLFVISILWVHFKKADASSTCGDPYNDLLSFLEFKLAAKTFCAVYGHEELTEHQMRQDFQLLDVNKDGSISFSEICDFCCKCIDPKYLESAQLRQIEKIRRSSNSGYTDRSSSPGGGDSNSYSHRILMESSSPRDPPPSHSIAIPSASTAPVASIATAFTDSEGESDQEDGENLYYRVKAKEIREHSAAVGVLIGANGDYLPADEDHPQHHQHPNGEQEDDYYLLKPLHTIPSRTLIKELMEPLSHTESERIVHVPRQQYPDGTTAAMMSILGEMKKQEQVQHLTEIRFATELSLEAQGFSAECITGITLTTVPVPIITSSTTSSGPSSARNNTSNGHTNHHNLMSTNPKHLLENPLALLLSTAH